MRTTEPEEFRTLAPGGRTMLARFVVVLLVGALSLVLSLPYMLDSLPTPAPGEGLARAAATTGVAVGVMLLAALLAVLLCQVAVLTGEIIRLREEQRAGAADGAPIAAGADAAQRPAERDASPEPARS